MKFVIIIFLALPYLLFGQDENEIPNSINFFGLDACFRLSETPDHLLSPASISTALGMTYIGSEGQTREQIKRVFYYPEDPLFLNGFSEFIRVLNQPDENTTISSANKLWAGEGRVSLDSGFVYKNAEYFKSALETISFDDQVIASQTINKWVAENTGNNITELMDPGRISSDAILVLTNAIYFKSNWAKKFDPGMTKKGEFTNDRKQRIDVDFMINDGFYHTFEDEFVQAIELPYAGDKYSFIILLPKTPMEQLEEDLTIEIYNLITRRLHPEKFEMVQVPKFKSSFKLDLKGMLTDMGMPKAFMGADFDGIGNAAGRIELSAVVHETFLEFNEEGTEAAAATGVVAAARSASVSRKFIADRPFIYILRHKETNTILFIGKMSNPSY